jgi:hypothetical protein
MASRSGTSRRTREIRQALPALIAGDRITSSAERLCGDCTLCCKVIAIDELAKPANSLCSYCRPGRGCTIYADRPAECESFSCVWLVNNLLDGRWRPNKSKLVLTTSEDGIAIRCDPGFSDAWRKDPYGCEIRDVIVIIGQRMILITPDQEFDLGVVGPYERIVRELEGRK